MNCYKRMLSANQIVERLLAAPQFDFDALKPFLRWGLPFVFVAPMMTGKGSPFLMVFDLFWLLAVQLFGLLCRMMDVLKDIWKTKDIQHQTRLGRERRENLELKCVDAVRHMAMTFILCGIIPIAAFGLTIYVVMQLWKNCEVIGNGHLPLSGTSGVGGPAGESRGASGRKKKEIPVKKPNRGDRFVCIDEGPHFHRTARGSLLPPC